MAHDLSPSKIFDVNGTKYRVGRDGYGYVQIQVGEVHDDPDTGEETFYPYEKEDEVGPHSMFDASTAREVADYIERLAE